MVDDFPPPPLSDTEEENDHDDVFEVRPHLFEPVAAGSAADEGDTQLMEACVCCCFHMEFAKSCHEVEYRKGLAFK